MSGYTPLMLAQLADSVAIGGGLGLILIIIIIVLLVR